MHFSILFGIHLGKIKHEGEFFFLSYNFSFCEQNFHFSTFSLLQIANTEESRIKMHTTFSFKRT